MQQNDDLQEIRNDRIQFVTMQPPGATLPTRERQIKVLGPPEAVTLVGAGNVAVLDRLVPLLADPDRAWAAEVMLAALTGHEADIVNDYQQTPGEFIKDLGTGAHARWQKWLDEARGRLSWDPAHRQFVAR